jgi:hypothetical protein
MTNTIKEYKLPDISFVPPTLQKVIDGITDTYDREYGM